MRDFDKKFYSRQNGSGWVKNPNKFDKLSPLTNCHLLRIVVYYELSPHVFFIVDTHFEHAIFLTYTTFDQTMFFLCKKEVFPKAWNLTKQLQSKIFALENVTLNSGDWLALLSVNVTETPLFLKSKVFLDDALPKTSNKTLKYS